MNENTLNCPEVEELAAELALGIASATERASAVVHLGHCASCRRLVDDMSSMADCLLVLAPEAEPTIGFESRVLAATGTPARTSDRPPDRRRLWMVAAAAAVLALAGVGGLVGGTLVSDEPASVRTALSVSASGRATCRAFAFSADDKSWVVVSFEAPREWTADYSVEVTTAGGVTLPLGSMRLESGQAALTASIDTRSDDLRSIKMFDSAGALRYEADFEEA